MRVKGIKQNLISRHRFAIVFFVTIVLYNFVIVGRLKPWHVSDITFTYHIVDYSVGFRSQLLPGAVFYGIFGEHSTRNIATIYETVLLLLFFAGISLLLEKLMRSVDIDKKCSAVLLIFFFLTGSFTFSIFTDELGMLDVYWLFFSLLFFFFIRNRILRWVIPVLYILSLLIHFSAVINYIVLFSIILLYEASLSEKKQKLVFFIIFSVSMFVTTGLFVYFLRYHTENLKLTIDEFHDMQNSRGSEYYVYYDYSFFNSYGERSVVSPEVLGIESPFVRVVKMICEKCKFTFFSYSNCIEKSVLNLLTAVLLLFPILIFIYKHLIWFFNGIDDNKLKKFCVFLVMSQFPFTAVFGCMFSPDVIRWFTHAFLIFFSLTLYLIYKENQFAVSVLSDMDKYKRNPSLLIYAVAWFSLYLWPYC